MPPVAVAERAPNGRRQRPAPPADPAGGMHCAAPVSGPIGRPQWPTPMADVVLAKKGLYKSGVTGAPLHAGAAEG